MSNWERLEAVIQHLEMNVNSFAKEIGLTRAERLYQIKRGNYNISKNLAQLITKRFPEINESWLLTGDGFMRRDQKITAKKIPVYNVGLDDLPSDLEQVPVLEELEIPHLENSDFAIINNSEAMAPDIAYRSMVFVQKVEVDAIIYGEIYLILSEKFNLIRTIREQDTSHLRLLPKNTQDFDEIILPIDQVKHVYKVKGVLSMMAV